MPTRLPRTSTLRLLVLGLALGISSGSTGCRGFGRTKASYADLVAGESGERAVVGEPAPDFLLPDLDGNRVRLSDFAGRHVVLEWFNPECPHVAYAYRQGPLATLAKRLAREDVVWMSINSNAEGEPGTGLDKNRRLCHDYGIEHRVLMDGSGIVGRAYGARTTPHVFVVAADGRLVYQGALDNAPRGILGENDPINYVEQTLEALSSGTQPRVAETEPYGCRVRYAELAYNPGAPR